MPKVLKKTLDILELFLKNGDSLSLKDIANSTKYDAATASRILSQLVEFGYLYKSNPGGRYSLGTKFLEFSGKISDTYGIRETSRPYLEKLRTLVTETVHITTWDGSRAIHVLILPSEYSLHVTPKRGTLFPSYFHSTGTGKVILSEMNEESFEKYFKSNELSQYTKNTINTINDLKAHLQVVKKEGVGYDFEENDLGVVNIATPVKNFEGRLVAIVAVLGPSARLTKTRAREITAAVKNCALQISKALGYQAD